MAWQRDCCSRLQCSWLVDITLPRLLWKICPLVMRPFIRILWQCCSVVSFYWYSPKTWRHYIYMCRVWFLLTNICAKIYFDYWHQNESDCRWIKDEWCPVTDFLGLRPSDKRESWSHKRFLMPVRPWDQNAKQRKNAFCSIVYCYWPAL